MENANQQVLDAFNAEATGYGFASFFYILGFIAATIASIYISPVFTGTPMEKRMMSRPQELEASDI